MGNNKEQARASMLQVFEREFENAMSEIDKTVKEHIDNGKEMAGITAFMDIAEKILKIHEGLLRLYRLIYSNLSLLKLYDSKRLNIINYELLYIDDFSGGDDLASQADAMIRLGVLEELGFKRSHPLINGLITAEIEYMLTTLKVLVEPEFAALENTIDDSDETERSNRYIPSAVKIYVWRRDKGKCVECGSNEKLEYDHVIPVSRGGSNTERNVQLLCEVCNRKKSSDIY